MDDSGPVEIWTEGPKFTPLTYTKPEPSKRGNRSPTSPTSSSAMPTAWSWNRSEKAPQFGGDLHRRQGPDDDRPRRGHRPIRRNWPRKAIAGARQGDTTSRTGSTASRRGRSPTPTWRSAIARPRSATWATSPAGPAASSAGTRSRRSFPTTPRPTLLDRPRRKGYELPAEV